MKARSSGFSLVEVLLVLALVGLALTCVAQMFASYAETMRFSTSKDRATQVALVALDRVAGEVKAAVKIVSLTPDLQLEKDQLSARPPVNPSLPLGPPWQAHQLTVSISYVFDPLQETLVRQVNGQSQLIARGLRAFSCTSPGDHTYRLLASVSDGKTVSRYATEVFRVLP